MDKTIVCLVSAKWEQIKMDNLSITTIREEFKKCRKALTALGDETRQHLFIMLLGSDRNGARVVDIAKETNLSRPAVSHHMQILREAEIVKSYRDGTKIYYYIDPNDVEVKNLIALFTDIEKLTEKRREKNK